MTHPRVDAAGDACDVSVIVTGHGEGDECRATFAALARSVETAARAGLVIEVLGVLDRADEGTTAAFGDALSGDSALGRLQVGRVVTTDHGDPGLARNAGVRLARGAWVCLLDADNLPSGSWLRDAHAVGAAHGRPCVVHPERLVIFGERWEVWPQLPTDHPGFRAHNFFDRTYWDTFCLAARSVLEHHPYAATSAAEGLGPEDWHWGMETVHAGIPHLVAPDTALFYRAKASGSVQGTHDESRSLLPPTSLLTDQVLARSIGGIEDRTTVTWRGLQDRILRDQPQRPSQDTALRRWLGRSRRPTTTGDTGFNVLHYKALNAAPLHLGDGEAVEHFLDVGRPAHLRSRLSDDELHDLAALDLQDYRDLHPDLGGLDLDSLLHHYLAHGRAEGRAASRTAEQRQAAEPVVLSAALRVELDVMHDLDAAVPAPTAHHLDSLRAVGPPADGSLTAGSRVWWPVVEALGPTRPAVLVVSSLPEGAVVRADDGAPVSLSRLAGWSRLADEERWRLIATVVVQYQPAAVQGLDAPELAEVVRRYDRAMRASTRLTQVDPGGS